MDELEVEAVPGRLREDSRCLDAAAEHVFTNLPDAYEILIESIESKATSDQIKDGDTEYEIILL